MPEISRFFGIVIKMFYDDHNPDRKADRHKDVGADTFSNGDLWQANLTFQYEVSWQVAIGKRRSPKEGQ